MNFEEFDGSYTVTVFRGSDEAGETYNGIDIVKFSEKYVVLFSEDCVHVLPNRFEYEVVKVWGEA